MEIIFQGDHNSEEAAESFLSVLRLFKERYRIENFKEIYLHLTLVDKQGEPVELVDSETDETYRVFEVYRKSQEFIPTSRSSPIKLVIDNTKKETRK